MIGFTSHLKIISQIHWHSVDYATGNENTEKTAPATLVIILYYILIRNGVAAF